MLSTFKRMAFPSEAAYAKATIKWYQNRPARAFLGRHQWVLPAALRLFNCALYGTFMGILGLFGCAQKRVNATFPQIQHPTQRIAVLPFESGNPYLNGASLSDGLVVRILQQMPGVQVIERKELFKILQERKLTLTGAVRPDHFLRLGPVLGVDAILAGSVDTLEVIQNASGSIQVSVKLMEVSTGRILWADRVTISHSSWSEKEVQVISSILMEKAAKKLAERLGKSPAFART